MGRRRPVCPWLSSRNVGTVVEKAEATDPAPEIAVPTRDSLFRPTRAPTLPATSKSPAKTHEEDT